MLKHLPRWVFASASKHVKSIADQDNIPIFFNGDEIPEGLAEYAECTIIGPNIIHLSKNVYKVTLEIRLLLTVKTGDLVNMYRIHDIGGLFQSQFFDIHVKKYGLTDLDDGSEIFCLRPNPDIRNAVQYINLGAVESNTNAVQAIVHGNYSIHTEGDT